jgi:hypothetical protein
MEAAAISRFAEVVGIVFEVKTYPRPMEFVRASIFIL